MDLFLANAEKILETAGAARDAAELTILVEPQGQIRMIADSDWPLESLRLERGATMAYRVSGSSGQVVVEGRSTNASCRLEKDSPALIARRLLNAQPCAPTTVQRTLPAAVDFSTAAR